MNHLTETHEHKFEIHNMVLSSQSISLRLPTRYIFIFLFFIFYFFIFLFFLLLDSLGQRSQTGINAVY